MEEEKGLERRGSKEVGGAKGNGEGRVLVEGLQSLHASWLLRDRRPCKVV